MHGVGQEWVMRAFNAFGHAEPVATPQQAKPDPEFPTVAYPNPEEVCAELVCGALVHRRVLWSCQMHVDATG